MNQDPSLRPKPPEHDERIVALAGRVDALFQKRQLPQHGIDGRDFYTPEHPEAAAERYQRLELNDEELAIAGSIFEAHLIDAPKQLIITFAGRYPGLVPPADMKNPSEFAMFASKSHDDVDYSYLMWVNDDERQPVIVNKEIMRITESVQPYVFIEGIWCEGVNVESISNEKFIEPYELDALDELVEALHGMPGATEQ